ncbi:hypothetical protein GGD56_003976 [Rhizobium mongolense]|uniref:Uncharacterized protein n=2 Tax=Rhizobium mongolense TaxID=57676 RepID=A0ABR6IQF6_9HYPH|nr:hypothetical protein [Rhizobium mongolense]TVZ65788.1 hypothetical protein BCL32_6121 [Rhizobium mongolense USDA 1844]
MPRSPSPYGVDQRTGVAFRIIKLDTTWVVCLDRCAQAPGCSQHSVLQENIGKPASLRRSGRHMDKSSNQLSVIAPLPSAILKKRSGHSVTGC